jgi:hypothetical protein
VISTVAAPSMAEAGAAILGRLAGYRLPMAAGVALVMEAVSIDGAEPYALIVVAVLLLFGAETLHSAAVLASRLVRAWVGWAAIVWNVASPAILPILSPGDPLLPDSARHSAAYDQHPAHPTGATIIITCLRDGLTRLGVMNVPDARVRPGPSA